MSPSNSSPFESRPTKDEGSANPSGGSADKGGQPSRPAASPFEAPQQPKPQAKPAAEQQRQAPASRPAPAVSKSPVPGAAGAAQGSANSSRPADARPAQARPAQARPAQAPAGPAASAATAGLVKPAPKAKVRRAKLMISKVDPWSVLKMSFLLSVALGIVTVVAALVLWTVLDLTGIFNQVNKLVGDVAGSESGGFDLRKVASLGQVVSFSTIIAVVNVVLLTAISTLSAVLYNLAATLVGGVGVTLTDD